MNVKTTHQVLNTLADYRILTSAQLARHLLKSDQMTRRCLREMEQSKWIIPIILDSQGKKGRPQKTYIPSEEGLKQIPGVEARQPAPTPNQIPHQIALNWIRILVHELDPKKKQFLVTTLAPNSLLKCSIKPWLSISGSNRLVPDAILCLEYRPEKRKLLFFVEMDMGTEVQKSTQGHTNNLNHKIHNYAKTLADGKYRHLDNAFDAHFKGFRVLLIANSQSRLDQINGLVESMSNTGFIWTTSLEKLQSETMAAPVWFSAGKLPLQSILGKLALKL